MCKLSNKTQSNKFKKIFSSYSSKLKYYRSLTVRFCVISGHSLEGVLPHCRDVVGVFHNPSRLSHQDTRWGEVLPLRREAVGLLHSPSRLNPQGTRWRRVVLTSREKQSVYSTAPADWATRTLVWKGVTSLERSSRRGLFWTSVRSVALEKEQWLTWGL